MLIACKQAEKVQNNNGLYIGHITIEDNILYLDEIEWITEEDKDRIEELGLSRQNDMPNGYYIYNPSTEIKSFEIGNDTVYNFVAFEHLSFMNEGDDRNYSTNKKEEFIEYLQAYSDEAASVPFTVEVKNGKVISITEQFVN